jgi:hypothetical protein
VTSRTETKLANLANGRLIALAEQNQDAAVTKIQTEARAANLAASTKGTIDAMLKEAEAKSQAVLIAGRAEADSLRYKREAEATAQAMAIRCVADAEAYAIVTKAAAELKQAQNLEETDIGPALAKLRMQTDCVAASMGSTTKIFSSLPPGLNLFPMPTQLLADACSKEPRPLKKALSHKEEKSGVRRVAT